MAVICMSRSSQQPDPSGRVRRTEQSDMHMEARLNDWGLGTQPGGRVGCKTDAVVMLPGQELRAVRAVVAARGPNALRVDDLQPGDRDWLDWSGMPRHLASVAAARWWKASVESPPDAGAVPFAGVEP